MLQPLIERVGNLASAAIHAVVERIEIVAHSFGHLLGALAQPVDEFAAIGLHGAIEFDNVVGDQAPERRGVMRNFLAKRGSALIEHLLECLQAGSEHVIDRFAAAVKCLFQRFGVFTETAGQCLAAIDQGIVNARTGLLQIGDHVATLLA